MRDRAVAAINAQLARLRIVLDRLTPGEDILKPKKFLGIFGRSNPILTYFDRYLSSEAEIEAALSTIMESRDMLFRDNVAISRSEERRGGKECVSTGRSRCVRDTTKKQNNI